MKNIILGLILLLGSESVFSEPDFSGPDFSEEEYIAIEEHYFSVLDDVFDVDRFSDGGFTFRFTQDMYRSILERQSHIDFDSMLVIVPKDKSIYDQVFNY
ncbi:MAG: hypothetical protein NVV73_15110 [Cellvibrionaceae bacterium]|nr:hypothetical protein [Cellvibrionaceae bacterium]